MTEPSDLDSGIKIPEIEIKKYMSAYLSGKAQKEVLQKYQTFSKADNFCDIERDLGLYYRFHNRRCITRTALRLMHKLEKTKNIKIFPAIFKCFTNFCAYPEACRFYVYEYVESQNRVVRLYFNESVKMRKGKDLTLLYRENKKGLEEVRRNE